MILQKLLELAEREGLMDQPDYEAAAVAWIVMIDKNGKLLGIKSNHIELALPEGSKKKPTTVADMMLIPRQETRTSGVFSHFMVDNLKYVFGMEPGKPEPLKKCEKHAGLFCEHIQNCIVATHDAAATALLQCLTDVRDGKQTVPLPDNIAPNDQIAFQMHGDEDLLHLRPAIAEHLHEMRMSSDEKQDQITCLISGGKAHAVEKLPLLKRVPGGVSSGVALVSFNANAFESYGLKGNANAPIRRYAADGCTTALKRLLTPRWPDPRDITKTLPEQKLQISDDTVIVFWTDGDSDFGRYLTPIIQVQPDNVKDAFHSIWSGKVSRIDLAPNERFYALSLMGAQGRAAVRGWFTTHITDLVDNLAKWFADIEIAYNTPPPRQRTHPPRMPMRDLIDSLGVRGKEIPSPLATALIEATWSGHELPLAVLQRALLRTRAEIGSREWTDLRKRDARAALIKAVLLRNYKKEVTPTMDPKNIEPGYLCGRLMAVLERAQEDAHGGSVNATLVDRYFGAASATPARVMPNLLRMMRNHISKAKKEGKYFIRQEKLADEVLSSLGEFPMTLNLEQQGWFVLGYHHQRHDLFQKKDKGEATE